MNSSDIQPGLDSPGLDSPGFDSKEYFDPDAPDSSEQEFAASLEAEAERPRFVLDVPDEPPPADGTDTDDEVASRSRVTDGPAIMVPVSAIDSVSKDIPKASEAGARERDWRDQVSAKVSHYRSRKPRIDRYPSLQLQFEARPLRDETLPGSGADAFGQARDWDGDRELQNLQPATITLETSARVLEFPRSAAVPTRDDELAEPVMERPRIVEAPEHLPPPPALGGILIGPAAVAEPERRLGFDVPLQSSPFSRRLLAGAADAGVVAIALAAFAYVFFRISGAVLPLRTAAEALAWLLLVVWPVYQYAFLVFSKTTPGLRLAKLEVTRFDGAPASRSLRRWRVLASLLSCASLGLGYAWCFLDEDQLSWHDRITKTHLGVARRTD